MEDRYLFKAKRIDNEEWATGSYVYAFTPGRGHVVGIMGSVHFIVEENGNIVPINEDTLCQCTGLKDKNGKLIWENDIIKTFDDGEEWCLSKIIFADTSLGCGWKTTDIKSLSKYNNNLFKEVSFGSIDSESVEIIGNMFDNKELLESEG